MLDFHSDDTCSSHVALILFFPRPFFSSLSSRFRLESEMEEERKQDFFACFREQIRAVYPDRTGDLPIAICLQSDAPPVAPTRL